jgi:SPOR domain
MSLVNGSQGQHAGRPNAQSVAQSQTQWGHPSAPQTAAPTAAYPQQQGYAPQYGGQPQQAAAPAYGQAPVYGQTQDYHFPPQASAQDAHYGGLQQNNYAPQFEPYAAAPQAAPRAGQPVYQQQAAAPAYTQQPQVHQTQAHQSQAHQSQAHQNQAHQGYGAAPQAAQTHWQGQPQDGRGFDLGTYLPHQQPELGGYRGDTGQHAAQQDWSHQTGYQGEAEQGHQGHGDLGFAQAAGGELEQGYSDEEGQDFDAEPAPRSRRPLMMVAALAGAIVVGSGMAYSYKTFFSGSSNGAPPIIKSANEPAKIKPVDAGGKQFAHTDSKIMGRLGDGSGATAAAADPAGAGEVDASGTRKVSTLVVGRDGSIQAPAAAPAEMEVADNSVTVPGMTVVDGLGPTRAPAAAAAMAAVTPAAPAAAKAAAAPVAKAAAAAQKLVVAPPAAPAKPVTIAKATPAAVAAATGSIEPEVEAAPAPVAKAVKKVAAAKPAAAPAPAAPVSNSVATTGSGSNGFVAVLASVPRSDSSRIDALKRFADMQQKYGSVLGGKTPDVAEANLGAKGAYHRLVVGPPGSREQAGAVCSQLKTQGYGDCWVTSY